MTALLATRRLDVVIGGHQVCRHLDWQVRAGEYWAILGKNGAGKSTLLATVAGLRPPQGGELFVAERPLPELAARELALLRGYLPQRSQDPFAATVLETALVGRHPHLGRWDWESNLDKVIAEAALAEVGLAGLEQRDVLTLSGGERQRLGLAQLLTQAPRLFLLDEPLAHLDINHQVAQMALLAKRVEQGAAVVAVLHDPGFAARYCRHALLLFGDGDWLAGPVATVVTAENLSRLYGHPLRRLDGAPYPIFIPE